MPEETVTAVFTASESATSPAPKVYVETYGCSFNVSDGEVMAGLLERDGFVIADSAEHADAVIVNSCTVKDRTWLDLKKRLTDLDKTSPAVILAGCAPKVPHQTEALTAWSQVGPNNLASIPDVVRRTLAGERLYKLDVRHDEARLTLPAKRRNSFIEILPISKGCLGACTFCQTVIARGRLRSFSATEITERIRRALLQPAWCFSLQSWWPNAARPCMRWQRTSPLRIRNRVWAIRAPVNIEERLVGRGAVLARNFAYKPIILPDTSASQGLVKVEKRERFHLHGTLLTSN